MTTEILWCLDENGVADSLCSEGHNTARRLAVDPNAATIDLELTGRIPPICDWQNIITAIASMPAGRYVRVE